MRESLEQILKEYSDPGARAPYLIAAGPGTGNMGLRITRYLIRKLNAQQFAEFEPSSFFSAPFNFVFRDGLVETSTIEYGDNPPVNKFFFHRTEGEHDIIFFTGNTSPLPGKISDLASYVIEAAGRYGVERICIPGAFVADIHHLSNPHVYGAATTPGFQKSLLAQGVLKAPTMNIAHNMNAWLLGMSARAGMDAAVIMSEIPGYNVDGRNIRAFKTVVEALTKFLPLDGIDISDLEEMLAREENRIAKWLDELRASDDPKVVEFLGYIDRLEIRTAGSTVDSTIITADIELDDSLKYIENLYHQALNDPEKVPELRAAVQGLDGSDRLLILRKYGEDLMNLLGYRM